MEGRAFIATNTDATYPVEDGVVIPGGGSIVRRPYRRHRERNPVVIGTAQS